MQKNICVKLKAVIALNIKLVEPRVYNNVQCDVNV